MSESNAIPQLRAEIENIGREYPEHGARLAEWLEEILKARDVPARAYAWKSSDLLSPNKRRVRKWEGSRPGEIPALVEKDGKNWNLHQEHAVARLLNPQHDREVLEMIARSTDEQDADPAGYNLRMADKWLSQSHERAAPEARKLNSGSRKAPRQAAMAQYVLDAVKDVREKLKITFFEGPQCQSLAAGLLLLGGHLERTRRVFEDEMDGSADRARADARLEIERIGKRPRPARRTIREAIDALERKGTKVSPRAILALIKADARAGSIKSRGDRYLIEGDWLTEVQIRRIVTEEKSARKTTV